MQIAWSNTGNDRNDDGIFPSTALGPASGGAQLSLNDICRICMVLAVIVAPCSCSGPATSDGFVVSTTDGGLRPPPPISVAPNGMPTGPTPAAQVPDPLPLMSPPSKSAVAVASRSTSA